MAFVMFLAFIVLMLWMLGAIIHFAGGYIHTLLILALLLVLMGLAENTRSENKK